MRGGGSRFVAKREVEETNLGMLMTKKREGTIRRAIFILARDEIRDCMDQVEICTGRRLLTRSVSFGALLPDLCGRSSPISSSILVDRTGPIPSQHHSQSKYLPTVFIVFAKINQISHFPIQPPLLLSLVDFIPTRYLLRRFFSSQRP